MAYTPEQIGAYKENLKVKLRADAEARDELKAEKFAKLTPPTGFSLTDWLARPDTQIEWRIHGLMPVDSRVMLAAQFKAGKTTLVGNVVRSLVDGDSLFDAHPTTQPQGMVCLLDFEMSERQLGGWLRDQRIQNTDRVHVVPMRGAANTFNILDPLVRAHWADYLRAQGIGFLVVDCVRPILDALGLDEHNQAGLFLTALDALMKDAGVTEALVVQHMGHTNERARGDSRLRDWPDVEWRLVREDDDPASDRFFTAFGRDVDSPEDKLSYDSQTRHLTIGGGSRKDARAYAAVPAIVDVLAKSSEPLSKAKIEKSLADSGLGRNDIRRGIHLATRDGKVVVDGELGPGGAVRYAVGVRPPVTDPNVVFDFDAQIA